MNILVLRFSDDGDSTTSLIFIDEKFFCFGLEDEAREVKVKGETRIPAGTYDLGIREEVSGMTKTYREKYPWFEWHLHVKEVPNFEYVYIHTGNTDEHTDGCLLVGNTLVGNRVDDGFVGDSRAAYEEFYKKVYSEAKAGNVKITYSDYMC